MAFQLSPGVNVSEIDLTTSVPAVGTSVGALAGPSSWGPAYQPTLISDENKLEAIFGKPDDDSATTFFTGASFLAYTNALWFVRTVNTGGAIDTIAKNASSKLDMVTVLNDDHWMGMKDTLNSNSTFLAKYPGELGNSLSISMMDKGTEDKVFEDGSTISISSSQFEALSNIRTIEEVINTIASTTDFVLENTTASSKTFAEATKNVNNIYVNYRVNNVVNGNTTLGAWESNVDDNGSFSNELIMSIISSVNVDVNLQTLISQLIRKDVDTAFNGDTTDVTETLEFLVSSDFNSILGSSVVFPSFMDNAQGVRVNNSAILSNAIDKIESLFENDWTASFAVTDTDGVTKTLDLSYIASTKELTILDIDESTTVILFDDDQYSVKIDVSNISVVNTDLNGTISSSSGLSTTPLFAYGNVVNQSVNEEGIFAETAQFELGILYSTETETNKEIVTNTIILNGGSEITPEFSEYCTVIKQTSVTENGFNFDDWLYSPMFGGKPDTSDFANNKGATGDELHLVVVDEKGLFTGTRGLVLETYEFMSKAKDAKTEDGTSNYWVNVINRESNYIRVIDSVNEIAENSNDETSAEYFTLVEHNWGEKVNDKAGDPREFASLKKPYYVQLGNGDNGQMGLDDYILGYSEFASAEDIDVNLVMFGNNDSNAEITCGVQRYILDNVTSHRKDCIALLSPHKDAVINVENSGDKAVSIVKHFRGIDVDSVNRSTSYGVADCNWKLMYDKYNDEDRWVPCSGDVAGLCAYTDQTRDAWWSPAGFNRGKMKNVKKLAWNPNQAERDLLYKNGVNPIASFPGEGPVLYGDKTLLSKPSAFDRINVRRLFIVLEKAIATAAKYSLFEFNDAFTRLSFVNMVEPFLADIKGRRGVYDFKVVCDESNNTPEVIDGNRFVGDIYIKPARSINFIQLNFVAVKSGVDFSEVVGQF